MSQWGSGFPEPGLERAWRRLDAAYDELLALKASLSAARGGGLRRVAVRLGLARVGDRERLIAREIDAVEAEISALRGDYDRALILERSVV